MDPITIGLLLAGTALSAGGGFLSAKDEAKRAAEKAAARNAELSASLNRQQGFSDEARGLFDTRLTAFTPQAQQEGLATAQGDRTAAIAGALSAPDAGEIRLPRSAPNVVRGTIAQRLFDSFTSANDRAKALGKLGGFSDQQFNDRLGLTDTSRRIGTINNFAQQEANLLSSSQDLAEAGATRSPSLIGPILQAAGGALGGFAGRTGAAPATPTAPVIGGGTSTGGLNFPMFR